MNLNDKVCKDGCVDSWADGCKPVCVATGCDCMNFDETYFKVEGIKYNNLEEANTIAKRFYKRYDKRKNVDVMLVVVDKGEINEYPVINYEAKKPAKVECSDTIDMFQYLNM